MRSTYDRVLETPTLSPLSQKVGNIMMEISMNTLVTKYYKGTVDNVEFFYDPENVLGCEKWIFIYDDNDTNDPEYREHRRLWENKAKKRITDLVAATTKWSELEKEELDDSN
tara:strand:+ start:94 stop:429 length:336 start_codon:yes stop_codon:yes gene_type:complete